MADGGADHGAQAIDAKQILRTIDPYLRVWRGCFRGCVEAGLERLLDYDHRKPSERTCGNYGFQNRDGVVFAALLAQLSSDAEREVGQLASEQGQVFDQALMNTFIAGAFEAAMHLPGERDCLPPYDI